MQRRGTQMAAEVSANTCAVRWRGRRPHTYGRRGQTGVSELQLSAALEALYGHEAIKHGPQAHAFRLAEETRRCANLARDPGALSCRGGESKTAASQQSSGRRREAAGDKRVQI